MGIKEAVFAQIAQVANEQHKPLGDLTSDLKLYDSGLDSLCLAIIVARLEEDLGLDPFASNSEFEFPMTVGDFVALYEAAAVQPAYEDKAA